MTMNKKYIIVALLGLGILGTAKLSYADTMSRNEIVLSSSVVNTASAKLLFSGPGAAYGIVLGTGAATNFICLRDSNTANTTSAELVPKIAFQALVPQVFMFPQPIRIYNGLSVNVNAANINEGVAVLYKTGKLP